MFAIMREGKMRMRNPRKTLEHSDMGRRCTNVRRSLLATGLEAILDITLREKRVKATTGDFRANPSRNGPRISQRREHDGPAAAVFSPAGMDKYFEEVLEPIQNRLRRYAESYRELITCMVIAGRSIEFV